jgi:hypothetical protein
MQSSWCRVSFAQGRCWTGECKDDDITKYQELNQMMQHGYEWFTKKSLDSVVPGLKLTSTYLHFCCGTSGRLGIPASVGPGVLGPVPWPATRLPEADTWFPRSEILTQAIPDPYPLHHPCVYVYIFIDSVLNHSRDPCSQPANAHFSMICVCVILAHKNSLIIYSPSCKLTCGKPTICRLFSYGNHGFPHLS